MASRLALAAALCLGALILLGLVWELWGAPLRPGGSWLVLKVFPLFLPLRGILHERRYTFQWASLLSLAYVIEGAVRASSDAGPSRFYAIGEIILAGSLFVACVGFARLTRR